MVFGRVNCLDHSDFCQEKSGKEMPHFIFTPAPDVEFDGKQLQTTRGEGIVRYLNRILRRNRGNLRSRHGRGPERRVQRAFWPRFRAGSSGSAIHNERSDGVE